MVSGFGVAIAVAAIAVVAAAVATPVESVRYDAVATLSLERRVPGPTIDAEVYAQAKRIARLQRLPDSVAVRIWARHGDRRVRVEASGPTEEGVAEVANTIAAGLAAWDVGAVGDGAYKAASAAERIEGPQALRRGMAAVLFCLPLIALAALAVLVLRRGELLPNRLGNVDLLPVITGGVLVGSAAIGVLVGLGQWAHAALLAAVFVWGAACFFLPVGAAGLTTLTLFLPSYNLGFVSSLAPGVGLFTCLAGALALVAAWQARASLRRFLGRPPVLATAAFGTVILASVVAQRGPDSLSVAKTVEARAVLLPLVVLLVFWGLRREEQTRLENVLASTLVGVGLAGAVLSVVQVTFDAGYVPAGFAVEQFEGKRAIGFSEHPLTWAAFLMLPLAISAARWTRCRDGLWLASVFVLGLAVILTGSRAAWIAMVVLGALVLARSPRAGVVLVASFAAAAAVALAIPNFHSSVADTREGAELRPASGRLGADPSARFRLVLFHAELDLARRHPLTGVGLGNVGPAMRELDADYLKDQELVTPGAPVDRHSAYLGVLAELGLLGLAAFLGVLAVAFAGYRRALPVRAVEGSDYAYGLTWALVAVAVIASFVDADRGVILWWLVGTGFAIGFASPEYVAATHGSRASANHGLAWVSSRLRRSARGTI